MNTSVHVVLVRPIYSSNIGSTARVVANMAGSRLLLIDPQCEINSKARQGAAGAQDQLAQAITYESWDDFYAKEGRGLRIGLTRRDGKQRQVRPLKETLIQYQSRRLNAGEAGPGPIYLIFGPEDDGLSAEDLSLVNFRCSLPTFGEFSSMNLSHAVLLALFITQDLFHSSDSEPEAPIEPELVPLYFPEESLRQWLEAMGFDLDARRASAFITLKRLLLQNTPNDNELMVLESILRQNIRKLREARNNIV